MDPLATRFTALARKDLSLLKYAVEFSQFTVVTAFDKAALNSLFWIRPQNSQPPRLESVYLRSRTQPEPSPPSPRCVELKPEPLPERATVLRITPEPKPVTSNQVREPATELATRESVMDSESTERNSVPYTVAEGEQLMDLGMWKASVPEFSPERASVPEFSPEWASVPEFSPERTPEFSPKCATVSLYYPESELVPEFSPVIPLSVPLPVLGVPLCSPSAHHLLGASSCHPPALPWLEYPLTPPPAFKPRTPPRPVDPSAPP
ncbi:diacylglycerol kinase kappa-like [Cyprinus carpio]|uniref:Diacylglycerol kinase kappa-like n=1 Tax=Cyprinus carpio TaxID=7962 RepID=A0A9Q9VD90_CYPCA|nr:diacylglycerol kinase kappa-like [Cyprinus carpio]